MANSFEPCLKCEIPDEREIDHGSRHIEQLIELVANGKLSLETSITHTFPLEQVNQGLDVLHEKTGNPIRVVITQ